MNLREPEIKIIDTVFDPNVYGNGEKPKQTKDKSDEKFKVHIKYKEGTRPQYKVWLFLSGNELPFVESVTYHLHETFVEPIRQINRSLSNPDCRLVIWTWGIFEIIAKVVYKSGETYHLKYNLNYGNLLEEYQDKIKYVEKTTDSKKGATLIPA